MTTLTLRQATPSDLAEIIRLEHAGFTRDIQEAESTFADRIQTFPQGCLVLSDETANLAGYLCAELWPYTPEVSLHRFTRNHSAAATHDPSGHEIYISSMVVDPNYRGMGLSRRLFSDSIAYIRDRFPKVHSAILIVHPDWQAARQVYRSHKFVEIGIIEGYFTAGEAAVDAVIMRTLATA